MAQTYLTKTNPTGGNRTKGTVSVWIKRGGLSSYQNIYTELSDTNNFGGIRLNSNDTLGVFSYDSGSAQLDINTNRKFRDTNAWYHIVVAWDTTDGTAADRIKIYINGERETSFSGSPTYPSSSQSIYFGVGGSNYPIVIGRRGDNAEYFDGSMSHFHRVDNQALAQTVFGSTDSTTGEWKINTNPSITYTGSSDFNFFILKDGNSVTAQSGQSNNLTVGYGTLTKTEDNPSNVFATGNPIDNGADKNPVFSNGNNSYSVGSGVWRYAISTLGMTKGKFYMEQKIGSSGNHFAGVTDQYDNLLLTQTYAGSTSLSVGYYNNGNRYIGDNATSYGNSYTSGDIIGVAIDIDNGKIYFSKNGTWQNSGVPTSGSTGTGAIDLPTSTNSYGTWFFVPSVNNSTSDVNYGNGYFGTTAVSSAGTNASNNGIFEYDVPAGYTALSTKGLNL